MHEVQPFFNICNLSFLSFLNIGKTNNFSYFMSPCINKIQKQPSRDVLRKISAKNMQQMYRITPTAKRDFNQVALQICCIFSEQIVLRTPLNGYFWEL